VHGGPQYRAEIVQSKHSSNVTSRDSSNFFRDFSWNSQPPLQSQAAECRLFVGGESPVASRGDHSFRGDASMREQIRSIPPALQHGNRRDAPAVRNPKRKPSNAIKHGVFSIIPVMPGEDPREFEAIRSAVRDEWQPSGPTEEDKVFAIAHAIWCKLRAQRFLAASCWPTRSTRVIPTLMKRVGCSYFPITCALSQKRRLRTMRAGIFAAIKLSISKRNFRVRITRPRHNGPTPS
jgi:hypothetical protein